MHERAVSIVAAIAISALFVSGCSDDGGGSGGPTVPDGGDTDADSDTDADTDTDTGTDTDGTASGDDCSGWGASDADGAHMGSPAATDGTWIHASLGYCNWSGRFYCVSQ